MRTLYAIISILSLLLINGCAAFEIPPDSEPRSTDSYEEQQTEQSVDHGFEVEVYADRDFRGKRNKFYLEEGWRHSLIEFVGWDLNDRISSIHCGRGVAIALFRDRDFRGPVAIVSGANRMLDYEINDWASSLIVFDIELGGPLGVWIGEHGQSARDVFDTNFSGNIRFLPLPERQSSYEARFSRLDAFNDNVEYIVLGPASSDQYRSARPSGRDYFRSRSRRRIGVEVRIWEHADFRGRSLILPDNRSRGKTFELADFDFNRIASSLTARESSR